ncbi:MAG: hypothetical protein ABEJ99_03185 [Candidatus Nanohaloarchaea archaeon]
MSHGDTELKQHTKDLPSKYSSEKEARNEVKGCYENWLQIFSPVELVKMLGEVVEQQEEIDKDIENGTLEMLINHLYQKAYLEKRKENLERRQDALNEEELERVYQDLADKIIG